MVIRLAIGELELVVGYTIKLALINRTFNMRYFRGETPAEIEIEIMAQLIMVNGNKRGG